MQTKTCSICDDDKEVSDFHVLNIKTGKLRSECKECRRRKERKHYADNIEEMRAKNNSYYVRKNPDYGKRRVFESCEKSKIDENHVWFKCNTCLNEYNRDYCKKLKEAGIKRIRKTISKYCKCKVPVLLMKNSENGISSYCKTCSKKTNI